MLLAEVMDECTYVRHHKRKIVLVLAAMRHFAAALRSRGVTVEYVRLDDPANTGSLRGEVLRAASRHRARRIIATEPGEWRVLCDMRSWQQAAGCVVEIRDDDRFLCPIRAFKAWARGSRPLRMEYLLPRHAARPWRLMDADGPAGGHWNYDIENRKRLPARQAVPPPRAFAPMRPRGRSSSWWRRGSADISARLRISTFR